MHALASRFVFAALLAAPAIAAAQPSATPTAAPQNTDWSQVSNINGQLVPVGEKNDYLYDFKRTIVSANPIGWIMGFYGVSASYALDDHLAIRGELDYISPPDSHEAIVEGDVGLPIYFKRTYQGVFLEPGLVVRQLQDNYSYSYDANGNATTSTNTTTQFGPQVLVGWHWTWESGLNFSVAAGVGRNLAHTQDPNGYSSSDEQYIPNGYMRFGYAF
ncbi:MAG TPA: hypothetical protein VL463_06140 [Kofleriaceae bacterium]|nr:hypothetical protein [Kofleriaceae bacterium]